MNGQNGRRWWNENGIYVMLFLALTVKFAIWDDGRGDAFLFLPLSAAYSLYTVVRFLENRSALAFWWIRRAVCWLSCWGLNFLISLFVLGFVSSALIALFGWGTVYFAVALAPPSLLMIKQIADDCYSARHDHGSLTEAGRALRLDTGRFAVKAGIP